ncbi:hypothetical protein [Sulfurimonas sp.]
MVIKSNHSIRERIAVVSARANLAENISVEIQSYFKIHVQVVNDKKSEMSKSIIEQKAHRTLYILVSLPQTLQQIIKQ